MRWFAIAVLTSACLHDRLVPCGELLCAVDATCVAGRCVSAEALAACASAVDGSACATSDISSGVCSQGTCVERGCGDGVVEAGEICDDGNTIDGDGCAADCSVVDRCPPIGVTPRFSPSVHQPLEQPCVHYTASAIDLAIARCSGWQQGPRDGPFAPIVGLGEVVSAVLAPEGDELFTLEYIDSSVSNDAMLVAYRRASDGTWSREHEITVPFALDIAWGIGTPTAGPSRRMFVWPFGLVLHEIAIDSDGNGTQVGTTDLNAIGAVGGVGADVANLTPDGLRVVIATEGTNEYDFYTDRTSIDAPFRHADKLELVVEPSDPFMMSDCSRLYFSAEASLLYVPQR